MNVADVKRRVIRRFGDASNLVITSADIYDWINDAQDEICRQTDCLTGSTDEDASNYSANGVALPTGFIRTLRVTYNLSGEELPLSYASIDELDNLGVSTTQIKDVPRLHYHTEGRLKVYPSPTATDTNNIRHVYSKLATSITSDATAIDVPVIYHNDVVTFCMMRAYERDQNYRAMDSARAEFMNAEANRREDANTQDDTYLAVQDYDWDW